MDVKDAKAIRVRMSGRVILDDEDFFYYTEAMEYLIGKEPDPHYMVELAAQYGYREYCDMERKYYEMAAALGDETAMTGLGNYWFSGKNGCPDYEKAFEYFSAVPDDIWARCHIADMYKNGYYVPKDYHMYKDIIEELYSDIKNCTNVYDPVAVVCFRLADIRADAGRIQDAIALYTGAKNAWARWIPYEPCPENIRFMREIVEKLYKLKKPDARSFDLYDLFELMKKPVKIKFMYGLMTFTAEAKEDNDNIAVFFEFEWYKSVLDLLCRADIDGDLLVELYGELHDFEVV